MKNIIAFSFLLISVGASAQNDVAEDTAAKPAISAIGKPDGARAEMKIGNEGGSFTSSDGKLRLIIPEGAVSKKTTFSIQPTTNFAPNGNGKAYQMKPSGINFQQPVQIIFYYSDNETEGSPDLMGIAMQDDKGLWSSLNKAIIDTVAKTIKADIRHFSSYVNYLKARIDPSSARVKVNGSRRLKITLVSPQSVSGNDDELTALGTEIKNYPLWSVNGISKGNSTTGFVSVSQNYSVIYQAPAQIPEQNPVAVSVDFKGSSTNINEKQFKSLKLVCNILIYDNSYEVKMESVIKSGGKGEWGGVKTVRDNGSFIVSLEKNKPVIINIKNNLEVMADDCQNILLNPTTCTGLLHVAGTKQIKVTPANPPGQPYPIVEIWFVPFPLEFSRVSYNCPSPDRTVGNSIGQTPMMPKSGKAFPHDIKFIAKDGEQIIIESPKDSDEGYLKIWVRQLKDD